MPSPRKAGLQTRAQSTLRLPPRVARERPAVESEAPAPRSATAAGSDGLRTLLSASLWPLIDAAFRDAEDHVEARFFQIDDLQLVVSRLPLRESRDSPKRGDAQRRVTLEVWPAIGPRLLQVEWHGRRPHIVQRREGDWLPRLIRASREFE